MRSIAIVGAGQAGLQVGLGLLQQGCEVTMLSDRTPNQLWNGRVLSSQFMFDQSLETERKLGLNFWEDDCPYTEGIALAIADGQGGKAIDWEARLDRPGQSVDQRVKMPGWMHEFQRMGGDLRFVEAGVAELEELAEANDLVIVASGKGEIGKLFERDEERSEFSAPQRALALTYLHGMAPRPTFTAVAFSIVPGVGEHFTFPALTTTGPCDILVFEGVPGGPMDCWHDVSTPEEHLERSLWIFEEFMPWEAERCRDVRLTDDQGILAGRFPPTIRKPVAQLPSGAHVVGMADAVVLNDPITGQGSNNAAKCADVYYRSILARGNEPFDPEWMQATFEAFWEYVQYVVDWTNTLLKPPEPHLQKLLGAAQERGDLAHRIVNGFDHPPDYHPWWFEEDAAEALLAEEPTGVP
ncbi:FAD-binding oxidoreductase [Egibacter rhizosphaerae]|uniref:FAD-binding oxidoreductase n=1 Tax=Egibacter rhizosphaerae TaxID=1670831 RepID=A0A411YGG0_9ACTN|nr:styrene monooxygenase/indole monooxygenase family protein [Egibacter rhizosphaerae]QBI20375.1 FAD-binding oxidoreductase [Egibacter rhizosphaerae]